MIKLYLFVLLQSTIFSLKTFGIKEELVLQCCFDVSETKQTHVSLKWTGTKTKLVFTMLLFYLRKKKSRTMFL